MLRVGRASPRGRVFNHMSAQENVSSAGGGAPARAQWGDIAAIAICALAWGTTFYAITLQLGVVDPVVSIVYRFTLAAALLFVWAKLRGEGLGLNLTQHAAAIGTGFFTFSVNYSPGPKRRRFWIQRCNISRRHSARRVEAAFPVGTGNLDGAAA